MIENAFGRYYIPELDVLHLFKSLCEAVLAFHECDPPLAHRDIKVNYTFTTIYFMLLQFWTCT